MHFYFVKKKEIILKLQVAGQNVAWNYNVCICNEGYKYAYSINDTVVDWDLNCATWFVGSSDRNVAPSLRPFATFVSYINLFPFN